MGHEQVTRNAATDIQSRNARCAGVGELATTVYPLPLTLGCYHQELVDQHRRRNATHEGNNYWGHNALSRETQRSTSILAAIRLVPFDFQIETPTLVLR
jgi:hypothetical protein